MENWRTLVAYRARSVLLVSVIRKVVLDYRRTGQRPSVRTKIESTTIVRR